MILIWVDKDVQSARRDSISSPHKDTSVGEHSHADFWL
jgi:hypothetical protein